MSNQPGFDYDQMFNRLHLGLQHWRDNRRARVVDNGAPASPPTVVAAASSAAVPQAAGMGQAAGQPAPQGFVSVGGQLFPVYSDTQFRSPPDMPPSPAAAPEPAPPEPAPPTTATPPSPSSAPPPPAGDRLTRLSSVAPLKIPLPTPPPCLGRVVMIDDEPESAAEPTSAAQPARTATMDPEVLEEVLQRHSDAEAARLEQVQAEHRVLVAGMLDVHRAQLADQAERQHQLIRDLLTGHRAELDARAEAMRQVLTQHREDMQTIVGITDQVSEGHAPSTADMHDWLAQQAKHQAEAHAHAEQHLADLADMLGGLGQTVSHLAAATFERRPTFVPPPLAAIPWPPPSPATTQSPATTLAPTTTSSPELSTNGPTTDIAPQPDVHPGSMPAHAGPASPDKPSPPPSPRSAQQQRHEVSLAQARVHEMVGAFDDDDLQDIVDPEDPPPRSQLPPLTPPDHLDASVPAHV